MSRMLRPLPGTGGFLPEAIAELAASGPLTVWRHGILSSASKLADN
jgi:hypothetical protein